MGTGRKVWGGMRLERWERQESRQGLRMQSIILCVQVYGSLPWWQIMWLREGKPGDRGRAFEVVQVEMMVG